MAKKKVFSIGSSLSDGLEQTIAAAHNYSNDLRIDVVPLKKIEVDPENPRALFVTMHDLHHGIVSDDPLYLEKSKEIESLESLANSIKDQGLINPVVVYETNNMYRLIAGERRTLASILAGKTDIQAKIVDGRPNELRIRILQWIENIERSDLSLKERIDNLAKITDAFAKENGLTSENIRITDIAKLIGCAKSHAINLKAVLNAQSDIKKLIAEDKIRNLEKAALLTNIQNETLRQKAIDDCIHGATLKKLKEYLEIDKNQLGISIVNKKNNELPMIVTLGSTHNVSVARLIFNTLIQNIEPSPSLNKINSLDLQSPYSLTKAFKLLISQLEQTHE